MRGKEYEACECVGLLFSSYSSLATLSVVISLRYCLPFSVRATRCSAAVLFGGSSKFLQLAALKLVSVSVTVRRGFCWCFPDFGVFVFIKFWQRHATVWVYSELGTCLSLHVYKANVCSGKITLLHVCVCVCVCFYWKSEYFDCCSLDWCHNTFAGYLIQNL